MAIAFLILVLTLVVRKRFRKTSSALAAILLPILLLKPINWGAECLHLALTAGFGLGQLGWGVPKGNEFYAFDWSVGLAGGTNTFLIHDVTDEIALPRDQHKHLIETENGFDEDCGGKVEHLLGHYYVCRF